MPAARPGPIPEEALAYFRRKEIVPGWDYRDVWRGEHRAAFTVAKMMRRDLLASVRESIDAAIANGVPYADWSRDIEPMLADAGWWGRGESTDPKTGETRVVQLGSPRRLDTIYRTNMRVARAAGQWSRMTRTADTHPFAVYELGPSAEHRAEHAAWAGTVLPLDNPWWDTHAPPNGWGCKCRMRQLSRRAAERLGGVTAAPPITTVEWRNKRTGKTERVPAGIDPGWDYNPGRDRQAALDAQLEERE